MLVNFSAKDPFGPFSSPAPPAAPQSGNTTPRSLASSSFPSSASLSANLDAASARLRSDVSDAGSVGRRASDDLPPSYHPVPVLPDEFFAVLDAAKVEAFGARYGRQDGQGYHGGGGGEAEEGPGSAWFNWREHMPGDEDDEEGEEGRKGGEEGDTAAEKTPKPKSTESFQRLRPSL